MSINSETNTIENERAVVDAQNNAQMRAKIGVKERDEEIEVISASLWDANGQDYHSLEGMVGEFYQNKEEIKDAVCELVSANADEDEVKVEVEFFDVTLELRSVQGED